MNLKRWTRWFHALLASMLILPACAPGSSWLSFAAKTDPANPAAAVAPGWQTFTNTRWSYSISAPQDMQLHEPSRYGWTLSYPPATQGQESPNMIYILVAPENYPPEGDMIYSFGPPQAGMLLSLPVGGSISLNGRLEMADGLVYTRQPDVMLAGHSAAAFENQQPWKYPEGTKEIRYLLQANDTLYVVGGFINDSGAEQPGAISESLFNQIISTFQLVPRK
jgi:hypothetical protein